MINEIKVGDFVYTKKENRARGITGKLWVIETGKKWRDFDAVICKNEQGRHNLYLKKNLYKKEE